MEATAKMGWTVLPHPPHSLDLAPMDYHLFRKLKDSICGIKFKDNATLVMAAKQWLQNSVPEFYCEGIQVLVLRWCKAAQCEGGPQKNRIMFLEDVCTLCTSKNAVEQILNCRKIVGITFEVTLV
jgi:hypothetical protein